MEKHSTEQRPPLAPDSLSNPKSATTPDYPPPQSSPTSEGHLSISPPYDSPGRASSPRHSRQSSGHMSMSPPVGSLRNSTPRSSIESDRSSINISPGSSPKKEKPRSPENKPPPAMVSRDVFTEPKENMTVLEEPRAVVNRVVFEERVGVESKPASEEPKAAMKQGKPGGGVASATGNSQLGFRPSLSILKRTKRDKMLKRAALGFRIFGFLFCLVSLSVMAANRNQGWAVDSFYRYKEFRYCISVNAIGFVYSAAQAFDLLYSSATGRHIVHHQQQFRHYFDFALDQIIAYLLISASSSATIRVDNWQSNWGKDKFPDMATASISLSFLAFVALAANSLISGYTLCTSKSL